jgi:hypothetical protein
MGTGLRDVEEVFTTMAGQTNEIEYNRVEFE